MGTLASPSLERLIRDTRVILKQPKAENSNWSDTELSTYINDAIQKYFLVINHYAEGQFDKTVGLDVANGVETVALPTDFFSLKALYAVQNTTNKILVYDNNMVKSYDTTTSSGPGQFEPTYYFRGNNLVLRPIPGFTSTGLSALLLEYTAFPDTLLTGADVMTAGISPLFKELTVMYAVYKAKMSLDLTNGGNTRQPAKEHLADLYNNFKDQVAERSKYPLKITPHNPY